MAYPDLLPDERSDDGLFGVYVGEVTNNEDPEKLARVKVRFPWRDADDESTWARLAVPMAGPDRGSYFLPDVGDEVLVGFEEGDIHNPYVIGSLWNGQDGPPAANQGDNAVRTVRTGAPHEIRLDDDDSGGVTVTTAGGQEVHLDDANDRVVVRDTGGSTITVDANGVSIDTDGTIKLSGSDIELSASNSVDIEGSQIDVSGSGQVDIESNGQVGIESLGKLDIDTNGMLSIQTAAILTMKGSLIQLN